MSVRLSLDQLQNRLPEVLDLVSQNEEEYVVQRDGKDWAVIVNIRQWRRLNAGKRLDALGPAYRLSPKKQGRMEELLAVRQQRDLTETERRELQGLLRECDGILRRRAAKLDHLS
jgi:prevent-host-death family protein